MHLLYSELTSQTPVTSNFHDHQLLTSTYTIPLAFLPP